MIGIRLGSVARFSQGEVCDVHDAALLLGVVVGQDVVANDVGSVLFLLTPRQAPRPIALRRHRCSLRSQIFSISPTVSTALAWAK